MVKFFSFLFILLFASFSFANTINIVAAENFYGDIASEIGGTHVNVFSILKNPNQDPHLFSANPTVAKAISNGDIIIYNGIGYDPWIQQLLDTQQSKQQIVVVASLVGAQNGENPHLWYKPETSIRVAKSLLDILQRLDPADGSVYQKNYQQFAQRYASYLARIEALKVRYHGTHIIATEPVFNYLAEALGLVVDGQDFQLSIMNDVPPSPKQIVKFENALVNHSVRLLIYNDQVINPVTTRMQKLAQDNHIPIMGVYETEPAHQDFLGWMNDSLTTLDNALK